RISIRMFDSILSHCLGGPHAICTFGPKCDQYVVVEHTGEVFACDFFVEPEWRLGHLMETPLGELAHGERKRQFARRKRQVPNRCLACRYHSLCRGGCPKERLAAGADHRSLNYLCAGYKQLFDHALGKFRELAAQLQLRNRQAPRHRQG
ncbi:MAG: SPASM domain-containing protein, partial [Sedimentisphaerales bacterium]|nr:SPASM domain-containing protein [Sedimentisphaerales bacterium]